MIQALLHILTFTFFLYLVAGTLYLLIFAVAGRCAKQIRFNYNLHKNRMVVLIPAYCEDDIIVDTAEKACRHNYPKDFFHVIVIADSLEMQTLANLRRTPAQVLEVKFDVSTKAKSLHAALQLLPDGIFDVVVILDADNIMGDGCLEKINASIINGYKAVQCHRVAKNQDSPIAVLEAISEEININLFRRGQAALGFSAAPLGSGMAFEFSLLKQIFSENNILEIAGEDREIDIQLMKKKVFMNFINDAYIYDEKVANAKVFEKQRIRWFEAQWNHARRFFMDDMAQEAKTVHYFNKLFQTLILPRLLYLIVFCTVFFIFILQWIFKFKLLYPSLTWWASSFAVYVFVIFISVPQKFYNAKTFKAFAYVPLLMMSMLKAVFKMKSHRKEFLHTSKNFVEK